jgi:hypothetical protein
MHAMAGYDYRLCMAIVGAWIGRDAGTRRQVKTGARHIEGTMLGINRADALTY